MVRPNTSLDVGGGSASRNLLGAAEGALIRAAASTQPFGGCLKLLSQQLLTILVTCSREVLDLFISKEGVNFVT